MEILEFSTSGGARGGLEGATAPLSEASTPLPPRRRKFSGFVGGNFAKSCTKTPFFSHFSPPVRSSSPPVGKFLAPPLVFNLSARRFEGTFSFRKKGHCLKKERALICLLQNLGGASAFSAPSAPPGSYVYGRRVSEHTVRCSQRLKHGMSS